TGRFMEASPSRRRSTIEIEPITSARPATWITSQSGKSKAPELTAVPTEELWIAAAQLCTRSVGDIVIGDKTATEDDRQEQQHDQPGNRARAPGQRHIAAPACRVTTHGALKPEYHQSYDHDAGELGEEERIGHRADRLGDDQNHAGHKQD